MATAVAVFLLVGHAEAQPSSTDVATPNTVATQEPATNGSASIVPPANASPGLVLSKVPPLVIEPKTSAGHTWVQLSNPGSAPIGAQLTASPVTGGTTRRLLPAKVTFANEGEATSTRLLNVKVPPQTTQVVEIKVTDCHEPGESTLSIHLGNESRDVQIHNLDVPFNVGLHTSGTNAAQLAFTRDQPGAMVLENRDDLSYRVAWTLFLEGESSLVSGVATLPPKSTQLFEVKPSPDWFRDWFQGLLRNEQRAAFLTLKFAPFDGSSALSMPSKTQPVQLDLAYWGTWRTWVGNTIIMVTLIVGASLSMLLNLVIPNWQRRRRLALRLDRLLDDIRRIPGTAPSPLRVSPRVERIKIGQALRDLWTVAPSAVEELDQLDKLAENLRKHIATILAFVDVNTTLERLNQQSTPPTLLDEIQQELQEATDLLSKPVPTDAHLQRAQSVIDATKTRLEQLGNADQALATRLEKRLKDLNESFDPNGAGPGASKTGKRLRTDHAWLFTVLSTASAAIVHEHYHTIDVETKKLQLLLRFIVQFERHVTGAHDVETLLLKLFASNDPKELIEANRLIREVEQQVFYHEVQQSIKDGHFDVIVDPRSVRRNVPVLLCVRLSNTRFQESAASQAVICRWKFGPKVGEEDGWTIRHYFRNEQEAKFTLELLDRAGNELQHRQEKFELTPSEGENRGRSDANNAEFGRLLIAMTVALIGLIAGAREQFAKLDVFFGLCTVMLLGFSADAVKNVFTKSSSATPSGGQSK